jgi:hypothetical protein
VWPSAGFGPVWAGVKVKTRRPRRRERLIPRGSRPEAILKNCGRTGKTGPRAALIGYAPPLNLLRCRGAAKGTAELWRP